MATTAMEVTSGRYISGENVCEELGKELRLLSVKKVYLLGGARALEAVLPRIEAGLAEEGIEWQVGHFEGYCTYEKAGFHAERLRASGCGGVVGIGGGRCIDTAKAVSDMTGVPLGSIPTQAATCVACTNMAILYEESGAYIGPLYPKRPIAFTLADFGVLRRAPVRYIAAGIADALAKYPELKFSQRGTFDCQAVDDAALQASYRLSEATWNTLLANGRQAYADNRQETVTHPFTAAVNTNLVTTGVISGLARGSRQQAMAHAVYNSSTVLFPEAWRAYLHGEIVSAGVVLQLRFNRAPEEELAQYVSLAEDLGVPVCLEDLGIRGTGEELDRLCKALLERFREFTPEDGKRLREELERIVKR